VTRLLPLVLTLALAIPRARAAEPVPFEVPLLEEGISQHLVFAIHADRTGFLWLGTMYGLVRYDGRDFRTFRHDPFDSTSLSYDDVVCIREDGAGDLWIGTWGGGASLYDRTAGRFVRYLPGGPDSTSIADGVVWDVAPAPGGEVWFATEGGLDRLDPATGRFAHHRFRADAPDGPAATAMRAVLVRRSGAVWAGTSDGGLDSLDAATGRFVHHRHDPGDPTSLPGDRVAALHEDATGRLWVATFDGGLARLAEDGRCFERVGRAAGWSDDLSHPSTQAIAEDPDGVLWIGTMAGLDRLDPRARDVRHFLPAPRREGALRSGNVVAIGRDRSGSLWVSSYGAGLARRRPRGPLFPLLDAGEAGPLRDVMSFAAGRDGTLWIGLGTGLVARRPDGSTRAWRADPDGPLPAGRIRAIVEDARGTLWLGSGRGVLRGDAARERFARIPATDDGAPVGVAALQEARDGSLWIATDRGVLRLDADGLPAPGIGVDPEDPASLPDGTVLSLHRDRADRLWIGTYRGLSRLDPGSRSLVRFRHDPVDPRSLASDYVYAFHEDADGTLWLGTAGGLDRWDEAAGTFAHFRAAEGLPSVVVGSIVGDGAGALWLGTQRGLARFDPAAGRAVAFELADGLQSNLFHPGAALRREDGTILFGGPGGANAFRPEALPAPAPPPPVVLTDVRVLGRPSPPAFDATRLRAIRLPAAEAFLAFDLAPLDFLHRARTRGEVRLEGLDRAWVDLGDAWTTSYARIPPGRYTFAARARSREGIVGPDAVRVAITIVPPFWRTPAFGAFAGALLLAAALLGHRARVRGRVRRALELARAREDERETVRRAASADFHDELGHRLARIGLFAELLERGTPAAERSGALGRIATEARRLADEARDFFGTLGDERGHAGELVARLERFGRDLFERSGVEFEVEGATEALDSVALPPDVRRNVLSLFKEAMTNALRHAACTVVTLRASLDGDRLSLVLRDDGRGFVRPTVVAGRGLSNMELRARRLDGTLTIASEPGEGTRVALTRRVVRVEPAGPALDPGRDRRG